jgi:lipopolysaccharide export LptBFGC system permease protein LptF
MWNGPACIVALLIGLAMGISKFSSSPSRLAGIALLGALIFFLIHRFSYSLGIEQIISPDLAASLPFILIIFLAFVLFRIQK